MTPEAKDVIEVVHKTCPCRVCPEWVNGGGLCTMGCLCNGCRDHHTAINDLASLALTWEPEITEDT